jgi:hypothetical protein
MKTYLNLTNGLEFLPNILSDESWGVIRIQSTACEQKRWDYILNELDYDFLFNVAIGTHIKVVDYSARKEKPRALYQGLVWVQYVLNRVWYNVEVKSFVKDHNCTTYFRECYDKLDSKTIKRLEYMNRFVNKDLEQIREFIIETGRTDYDGKYEYYVDIVKKHGML